MRSDLVPAAVFPDYELSDHTGKHRKLSELQGQHPMVLVLSRGGFCPKDRRQAEGLVELHRELEVAYCRLVTISTDNITLTNEYRSGVGAHWPRITLPSCRAHYPGGPEQVHVSIASLSARSSPPYGRVDIHIVTFEIP
jgi:hypothetical protein